MARIPKKPLQVEALKHEDATRKNIPTAESESFMREQDTAAITVRDSLLYDALRRLAASPNGQQVILLEIREIAA